MRIQLLQNCLVEGRRRRAGEVISVDSTMVDTLIAQGMAVAETTVGDPVPSSEMVDTAVFVQPKRHVKRRAAVADDGFAPIPEDD